MSRSRFVIWVGIGSRILGDPMRLYQLGCGEFPPLRSLNWTNLPVQPTPLV
jgi:hypothetical protein